MTFFARSGRSLNGPISAVYELIRVSLARTHRHHALSGRPRFPFPRRSARRQGAAMMSRRQWARLPDKERYVFRCWDCGLDERDVTTRIVETRETHPMSMHVVLCGGCIGAWKRAKRRAKKWLHPLRSERGRKQ